VISAFATGAAALALASGAAEPSAVHVAPSGNDAANGTAAAPVRTFARAYRLARPGGVVLVAGGSYGEQRIGRDTSKRSAKPVTFRPAPGARVLVSLLDFGQDQFDLLGPHRVTVRDMTIDYVRAWRGSRHLVWQNIDARHFDIFDASDILVRGGDYGPCQAPRDDLSCVSRIAGAARVTVDGARIHDVTSTDPATYHVDGLFLRGGRDVVIRNSRFWGNMITNIRIQDQPCCANANVLIENNWFAAPLQGDGISKRWDAIDVDNDLDRLVVRNNSFLDSGVLLLGRYTRSRVVGNVFTNYGCGDGVAYARNVYVPFSATNGRRACGPTDRLVRSLGFVDATRFDLRLRPDSPAFGAGDPMDCAAVDIERRPRLRGLKCDAGAHELQVALVCERRRTVRVPLGDVKAKLSGGGRIGRC
jgi:hypothetical protein